MFGGQVGVGGHLTIGRGAIAVGQSGVTNSLDARAMVAGYPAIDSREWRKASVIFRRLPELKRRIEELEARLARLTAASDPTPKVHRVTPLFVEIMRRVGARAPRLRKSARRGRGPADPRARRPSSFREWPPSPRHLSGATQVRWDATWRRGGCRRLREDARLVANYQAILGDEITLRFPTRANLHPERS